MIRKKTFISQIIFFSIFALLLSRHFYEHAAGYVVALSPTVHLGNVVALTAGSASWYLVIPSLALILLGVFCGRLFCFYICPLGFIQDCLPSMRRNANFLKNIAGSNIIVFAVLFVVSLFAGNALGLFDPLVIFSRIVNVFSISKISTFIYVVATAGIIFGAHSIISHRLWCFYFCPLGAFFDVCIWAKKAKQTAAQNKTYLVSKRRFLQTAVGAVAAGIGLRAAGSAYAEEDLIRPPGALPEARFKQVCVRCGNCMNACITNGLQPALFESGWDGVFTPRLVPEIGECDEVCRRCGESCPTGAITSLSPEEKHDARIGVARVDKSKCLGWSSDALCLICGEYCPYLSIERYMKNGNIPCPVIKEDVCRGCGLCEKQCPADAIKVYRHP